MVTATDTHVYMEGLETPENPNQESYQMRDKRIQCPQMGILQGVLESEWLANNADGSLYSQSSKGRLSLSA